MRRGRTQTFAPGHHTERDWQKKFFSCNMRCFYCELPLTLDTATKDHRTPICRGGSDEIWNIVPACLPCNQKKGWRTVSEFLANREPLANTVTNNSQPIAGVPSKKKILPQPNISLEERCNEPGLLKKLQMERDGTSSWAWRNPA
jgi:hypothetical protein